MSIEKPREIGPHGARKGAIERVLSLIDGMPRGVRRIVMALSILAIPQCNQAYADPVPDGSSVQEAHAILMDSAQNESAERAALCVIIKPKEGKSFCFTPWQIRSHSKVRTNRVLTYTEMLSLFKKHGVENYTDISEIEFIHTHPRGSFTLSGEKKSEPPSTADIHSMFIDEYALGQLIQEDASPDLASASPENNPKISGKVYTQLGVWTFRPNGSFSYSDISLARSNRFEARNKMNIFKEAVIYYFSKHNKELRNAYIQASSAIDIDLDDTPEKESLIKVQKMVKNMASVLSDAIKVVGVPRRRHFLSSLFRSFKNELDEDSKGEIINIFKETYSKTENEDNKEFALGVQNMIVKSFNVLQRKESTKTESYREFLRAINKLAITYCGLWKRWFTDNRPSRVSGDIRLDINKGLISLSAMGGEVAKKFKDFENAAKVAGSSTADFPDMSIYYSIAVELAQKSAQYNDGRAFMKGKSALIEELNRAAQKAGFKIQFKPY